MKAYTVRPGRATAADLDGRVLAHTVRRPGQKAVLLRKGQILTAADLDRVRQAETELHLLEAEPGDLHEDEAGGRLARAAAGEGVGVTGPIESQYQLVAARRGLLRVDVPRLHRVNDIEGLSVFTTFDSQPVEAGENIGSVKITPLLIEAGRVEQAEALCRESALVVVKAFKPYRVAALLLERVDDAAVERFRRGMERKLGWFGSELTYLERVEDRVKAFVAALDRARASADLIMAVGASSLDPLEPLFMALDRAGAQIVKHGVPAHPGSLFWLAYHGPTPIFGLSSCEMFSHKTILDLVLPRLLAGERVGRSELVEMGHGGLLTRYMAFRFPAYDDSTPSS